MSHRWWLIRRQPVSQAKGFGELRAQWSLDLSASPAITGCRPPTDLATGERTGGLLVEQGHTCLVSVQVAERIPLQMQPQDVLLELLEDIGNLRESLGHYVRRQESPPIRRPGSAPCRERGTTASTPLRTHMSAKDREPGRDD